MSFREQKYSKNTRETLILLAKILIWMAMINEVTLPLVTNEEEILTYYEGVSE